MATVVKIVSGGQTGADRAGLDAAIELGIPHGGWCPKERLAEDGPIPDRYALRETDSFQYIIRTERNVCDSDATLIFHRHAPTGGTAATIALARRHRKPFLALDIAKFANSEAAACRIREWLDGLSIQGELGASTASDSDGVVLNVAGPRESTLPGIYRTARELLVMSLRPAAFGG